MAKYNYPNWHEIKDLVSLYKEPEWDDAKIVVWDPKNQCNYDLCFCGSTRPNDGNIGEINFLIYKTKKEYSSDEQAQIDYFKEHLGRHLNEDEYSLFEMIFNRGVEYGKNIK